MVRLEGDDGLYEPSRSAALKACSFSSNATFASSRSFSRRSNATSSRSASAVSTTVEKGASNDG